MKIDYINIANLELLEKTFNDTTENDINKDFGRNLPTLLSHITVSMVVSELTILEAMMLKRFSNSNISIINATSNTVSIDQEKFPKTSYAIDGLNTLVNNINNDNDIKVKPYALFFPTKVVRKEVLVKFTGMSLLNILGDINRGMDCIFIKLKMRSKEYTNNEEKRKIIESLIIENFIKEFYNFMDIKLQYIDLVTDSALSSTFLSEIDSLVQLDHVNTIYGTVPFIDIAGQDYSSSMELVNINKNLLPEEIRENCKSTEIVDSIYFSCNTSLNTFYEIFLMLPLGTVLEYTDIKILLNQNKYNDIPQYKKYRERISFYTNKIDTERANKQDERIDKFNLITLNKNISYTLKFNFSDISRIINGLKESLKGFEPNSYIYKEINEIIKKITTITSAVYKTFIK